MANIIDFSSSGLAPDSSASFIAYSTQLLPVSAVQPFRLATWEAFRFRPSVIGVALFIMRWICL